VVKGLRGARLGAVGARPAAFNTVRYSEKLLQASGISVTTMDLSELLADADALADDDPAVRQRLEGIHAYVSTEGVPAAPLVRMARVGVALDRWMAANSIVATALQCWNSLQRNIGINVCTLRHDERAPHALACEVDVTGAISCTLCNCSASPRSGGLEQQLWRRPGQVRHVPLWQLGAQLLRADGQRRGPAPGADTGEASVHMAYAESGHHPGATTTLGHPGRPRAAGPLATPDLHRRPHWPHPPYWLRRLHRRSLPTFGSRAVVQCPNCRAHAYICKEALSITSP
jgi:hypothetical protein